MEVRYQLRYSPGWDTPRGATASLRSDPAAHQIRCREGSFRPPRRAQGGGVPSMDSAPDDAFHVWRRHPSRPSTSSAQCALPSGPRTRQATAPSSPSSHAAATRPAAPCVETTRHSPGPRPARCSVRAAPTRVATSARVSPWSPRRDVLAPRERGLDLGPALADLGRRQALPGADVDLAEPLVGLDGQPDDARERLGGGAGPGEVAGDEVRRTQRRQVRPGGLRLGHAAGREPGVEVALPDAGGVVLGLAVPQDDDAAAVPPGVGPPVTDRPARCPRPPGRPTGSPSRGARARRTRAPRRAGRGRRCRRSR